MRTPTAIVAALGLGVAGCGAGAGATAPIDAAPLAVARAAQSSIAASAAKRPATARRAPAVKRSSAIGRRAASAVREAPTPPGPARLLTAETARPVSVADAPQLAAPACEQYLAALAGQFPAAVRARGEASALAAVTHGVEAVLLGLPIVAPQASLEARDRLGEGHARLSRALALRDDATATAIARAARSRLRAYAHALGITTCG